MGIDWYWIKQRPQIIAEMLNKDYDVTVAYYKELFVKQSLRKNNDELENSISISAIPYRDKNKIAYAIQKLLFHRIMKNVKQFDIVWISHPLLYRYLPPNYDGKVIYDCMDNHEALCNDKEIFCNFGGRKISLRKYDSQISCFPSGDKGFRPCV